MKSLFILELNELHHVLRYAEVTANKMAQIKGRSIEEIELLLSEVESIKVEAKKYAFITLQHERWRRTH